MQRIAGARLDSGGLNRVGARARIVVGRAVSRPGRNHEQMDGQAPRAVRLEHVVLEHKVVGVGPVVRDVATRVVAHHVNCRLRRDAVRIVRIGARTGDPTSCAHEAVHTATVDVVDRGGMSVRAAHVHVVVVRIRLHAWSVAQVAKTHRRDTLRHWDAVGTGIRSEVAVERTILLHDHDDVLDLVDPDQRDRV